MKILSTNDVAIKRAAMLVVGPSGVGKTSLVKTLPEKDTLIISLEAGLLCLQGTNYPVVEVHSKDQLNEICNFLQQENIYKYIFIDSLTEMGQMILAELKQDPKLADPKNSFLLWGKYAELVTAYIKFFRDLEANVVMTCLEGSGEDGLEKISTFNIPGASIKDNIKSWLDICLVYKIFENDNKEKIRRLVTSQEEHSLAKDRSGKLRPYEVPNLIDIFNKILKGELK